MSAHFGPLASDALLDEPARKVCKRIRMLAPRIARLAARLDRMAAGATSLSEARGLYALVFKERLHCARLEKSAGGLELALQARALVLEELARADAGLAMALAATWNAAAALAALGSLAVRSGLLAACVTDRTGRWMLGSGMAEADRGSDAFNFVADRGLMTTIRRARGGFEISGAKVMVTNGGSAPAVIICAQASGQRGFAGRRYAVIDATAKGFRRESIDKRGLRSSLNARIVLDRVWVSRDRLLDRPPTGPASSAASLAPSMVELSALFVGSAQALLECAQAHAESRSQAGLPLLRHPGFAARVAQCASQVSSARALTWQAAALADLGDADLAFCAGARAQAKAAAFAAATLAIDTLASAGVERGSPLDRLLRNTETLAATVGAGDLLAWLPLTA